MRGTLAAIVIFLTLVTSVQAATPVEVARTFWPGSPCEGREVITTATSAELVSITGHHAAGAGWMDGSCRVAYEPQGSKLKDCMILAHEFGHLAGRGHDAGWIMGDVTLAHDHCHESLSQLTVADARQVLPRARCRRASQFIIRCRTRWSGLDVWRDEALDYGLRVTRWR